MAGTKIIKQLLIERNMSVSDLASLLQIKPQSMSNKLQRDSFSFAELIQIAELLNCDVRVITKDTKKIFEV